MATSKRGKAPARASASVLAREPRAPAAESREVVPRDGVVWCERCHRWTRTGEPYMRVGYGKFVHRICGVPNT